MDIHNLSLEIEGRHIKCTIIQYFTSECKKRSSIQVRIILSTDSVRVGHLLTSSKSLYYVDQVLFFHLDFG